MAHMQNPVPFLTDLVEKDVIVKLKWGVEYKGKLLSFDSYMNQRVERKNLLKYWGTW